MQDWIQTLSIMATVIGTAYYILRDIKIDMQAQTSRIDAANARIDSLHTMFYDLLKEVKK
jgi:hypothetical protein